MKTKRYKYSSSIPFHFKMWCPAIVYYRFHWNRGKLNEEQWNESNNSTKFQFVKREEWLAAWKTLKNRFNCTELDSGFGFDLVFQSSANFLPFYQIESYHDSSLTFWRLRHSGGEFTLINLTNSKCELATSFVFFYRIFGQIESIWHISNDYHPPRK